MLSKLYFSLRGNPETDRFFRGYESAGKTIGYAVLIFGNVGLYYFSEKAVACLLTFLSFALYCLCTLFCIQPYTDFGALEFLLGASLNQTLSFFGLRSSYTWLVIIVCIVIAGIRYRLEPVHSPGEATSHEDQLESGLLLPMTRNEDRPPFGTRLYDNVSPSESFLELVPGGSTSPLLEGDFTGQLPSPTYDAEPPPLVAQLDDNPTPSDNFLDLAQGGSTTTSPLLQGDFIAQLRPMTQNEDPLPPQAQLLDGLSRRVFLVLDDVRQDTSKLKRNHLKKKNSLEVNFIGRRNIPPRRGPVKKRS